MGWQVTFWYTHKAHSTFSRSSFPFHCSTRLSVNQINASLLYRHKTSVSQIMYTTHLNTTTWPDLCTSWARCQAWPPVVHCCWRAPSVDMSPLPVSCWPEGQGCNHTGCLQSFSNSPLQFCVWCGGNKDWQCMVLYCVTEHCLTHTARGNGKSYLLFSLVMAVSCWRATSTLSSISSTSLLCSLSRCLV